MTTISLAPARRPAVTPGGVLVGAAAALCALLLAAVAHRVGSGGALIPTRNAWLALHLGSVIPAIPLGGYVLWRRKGDRLHRLLGRSWAVMMMAAALSSFGLHGLTGRLSWIHILSIVVLVTVPRGIMQAVRGDIARHRATMMRVYTGLIVAGFFTVLPGRLLGSWLFG